MITHLRQQGNMLKCIVEVRRKHYKRKVTKFAVDYEVSQNPEWLTSLQDFQKM